MVGSQKILTVSYGTFSCTLEGFEDAFETMKAIAEYFRDLAADDRYFGAEPPTPDAEMLARIAEREIARRVEPRLDSSGIVLRAGGAIAVAPADPATPAPAQAAPRPVAVPEPPAAAPTPPRAAEEPVLAAEPAQAEEPVLAEEPAQAEDLEGAGAAPAAAVEPPAPQPADADQAAAPVPPPRVMPRPVAPVRPAPRPEAAVRPAPVAPGPLPPHPDANSVAAKLQRIRAVVGKSAPVTAPGLADDSAEDDSTLLPAVEAAIPDPERVPEPPLSDAREPAAAVSGSPTPAAAIAAGAEPDDSAADAQGRTAPRAADGGPSGAGAQEGTGAQEGAGAQDDVRRQPRILRVRRADFERALAEGRMIEEVATSIVTVAVEEVESPPEEDAGEEDALPSAAPAAGDAGEGTLSPEAEAALLAELAALEADARADDTGTGAAGIGVAGTGDGPAAAAAAAADEEAILAAVIASRTAPEAAPQPAPEPAQAEPAAGDDADAIDLPEAAGTGAETALGTPAAAAPAPAARTPLLPGTEDEEAALTRLVAKADAQLSDPEANRRREAIAQLKAAVAATEAARRLGEAAAATDREGHAADAFRDDLARVVRPRRPMPPTAGRSERPRPAPLKLVASQRVDLPRVVEAATTGPIRPRRVRMEQEPATLAPAAPAPAASAPAAPAAPAPAAPAPAAVSFAEFASDMGATSLSDLLEAAAAYTAFVEGMEDFSRPQLMKKVSAVAPDAFSREDTLRSFGTLLREGRINRAGMGRFRIAATTRFRPARRAG